MRPAQKSNRSRGRGNRKGGGGGNNINRVYDSAGPEGKVRGTPQQIIDKYLSLARDAQTSGDRVGAENFLQHAEHYQRIMIQATQAQEQARRDSNEQSNDGRSGQEAPVQQAEAAQPSEASDQGEAPKQEIGGMDMIDSAPTDAPLLVSGEEGSKPRAKSNGNGDGRRRPRKEAPPAEASAEPDVQAEG